MACSGEWHRLSPWCRISQNVRENTNGTLYLFRSRWSAFRSKRRFEAELYGGLRLPVSVAERYAPSKAVAGRLEFSFRFHVVNVASPLSGHQTRFIPRQSVETASRRWLQTGSLSQFPLFPGWVIPIQSQKSSLLVDLRQHSDVNYSLYCPKNCCPCNPMFIIHKQFTNCFHGERSRQT